MSLDLLVKNATLPDGRTGVDIACSNGRITAVEPGITAEAARVIDAGGRLVSPPFVDSHFHMDATLSLGLPRMNESGTLLGTLEEAQPFLLESGMNYTLEFSMSGSDTRTVGGTTLEWGVEMAYASTPAVVPGAGGLALCLGFGGRRRRRRI